MNVQGESGGGETLFKQLNQEPRGSIQLSVVIPAYNEAGRIRRTLEATIGYLENSADTYEILVVDDGSSDDTATVAADTAQNAKSRRGTTRVLRYPANRGKGYAVRYGVLRATGAEILYMDADLATPIEEIEKLRAAMAGTAGAEVALGSRPLSASQLLVRQPWYRELAGRGFNAVVQLVATPGIHDTQCGFKLLTADAARQIFSRARLDGFSFDVEVVFLARRLGYRTVEVPVRWAHQEGAAAFATTGAYVRHGLAMVADLTRIRLTHQGVRSLRSEARTDSASSYHPPA